MIFVLRRIQEKCREQNLVVVVSLFLFFVVVVVAVVVNRHFYTTRPLFDACVNVARRGQTCDTTIPCVNLARRTIPPFLVKASCSSLVVYSLDILCSKTGGGPACNENHFLHHNFAYWLCDF